MKDKKGRSELFLGVDGKVCEHGVFWELSYPADHKGGRNGLGYNGWLFYHGDDETSVFRLLRSENDAGAESGGWGTQVKDWVEYLHREEV